MKRVLLLLVLCFGGFLAGCGGGGQSGAPQTARSSGTVVLHITIPPASKLISKTPPKTSGTQGRLIPANTVNLHITYTAIDTAAGALNGTLITGGTTQGDGVLDVAVSPGGTPLTKSVTLTNFAAAFTNVVTILAQDSNGATVASGATTIDITPGSTDSSQNVTLQSTVDGSSITQSNGSPVPTTLAAATSLTLKANFTNTSSVSITTVNPTNLTWSISPPNFASGTTNVDGTFTLTELQPGSITVTATYTEYGQLIQSATTLAIALQTPAVGAPTAIAFIESDEVTNLPQADLFDLGLDANTLFYDATLTNAAIDASAGYSRIAPPATGFPFVSDAVEFDTNTAPTFAGSSSRIAYLKGATSANDLWIVVKNDQSQVTAFPRGYRNRATTGSWQFTPVGGFTIIDVDSKGSLVYLLETKGGAYQLETLNNAGVSQGVTTIPAGLTYTPTNLAVSTTSTETDYYLSGASHIARFKVPVSGSSSLNPDFTLAFQTPIAPLDIATSEDSAFLFELDSSGVIHVFYTADGTVAPVTKSLTGSIITPGAGVAGSRISAKVSGSGILLNVLDTSAGNTQIETYTLQ